MDEEASTRTISEAEMVQIKRKAQRQDAYEEQMRLNSQYTRPPQDEEYDGDDEYYEEDEYDGGDSRMEKVTVVLAVLAGVVICAVILVLVGRVFGFMNKDDIGSKIDTETEESSGVILPEGTTSPEGGQGSALTVQMVDVLGWNVEDAKREIVRIGLVPEVNTIESETYEENTVITTDIAAGEEVEVNSVVVLTVSAGTEAVSVPDVMGLTYEEAYNKITAEGLLVNRLESYTGLVEKGRVISQLPVGGEPAAKGSTVNVNVSLGLEDNKVAMPNLIGCDQIEAEEWIHE